MIEFPVKILFLDVDGVINIPPYQVFNVRCLENLKKIVKATGCKVVISSSWREGDLEKTKKHFPPWLRKEIIGETIRAYKYVVEGSNLPLVRGNEVKQWIDTRLKYPWHADKDVTESYKEYSPDGIFKRMRSNKLNKDFTYVILDDDSDMLYDQKDNFIQTNGIKGITSRDTLAAIEILNKLN